MSEVERPTIDEVRAYSARFGLSLTESRNRIINHNAMTLCCSIDTESEDVKSTLSDLKELIKYLILGELSR